MLLTPSQAQIAVDTHRFRVVNCGRRFGKTTLAVEEIKGKALSKPCRIAYIAPTHQQARDIAWELLKRELQPIFASPPNETRLEIRVRTQDGGESLIILRGWEAIETLRGQQFDFLVVDEIASMRNFWSNWEEVIRPTLTDTKGEGLFISTPKGFNHFYELHDKEREDTDFKSFHFTTYDNPFIPTEEIEKAKQELTEDRFAQEYMADFRKTEGLVYKEFDRTRHLYTEADISVAEVIAGIDFGFTNPTAVISITKDRDAHYWVTDEWYKTGQTDAQTAEYVAAQNYNKVYPDPESPSAIKELRNRKVNVREVIKNKDSIKHGIDKVRELFKQNRLHINAKCVNLIYELETYSYPEKKDLHNPDENPIKENDHALDALRYPIYMLEGKPGAASQFIPGNLSRSAIPQYGDMFKTSAELELARPQVAHQYKPNFRR